MPHHLFEIRDYTIRRKVFKLLGAGFSVLDPDGQVVGYSEQKAFRLREDIRIRAGEGETGDLIRIHAQQMVDFAAAYDVFDGDTGEKVGGARRHGLRSMLRDSWELYDDHQRPIARLQEDSQAMALVRRVINVIPQNFTLVPLPESGASGGEPVHLRQRFNLFVYKLDVSIPADCPIDPRLILAVAVLIAAIEGRQE